MQGFNSQQMSACNDHKGQPFGTEFKKLCSTSNMYQLYMPYTTMVIFDKMCYRLKLTFKRRTACTSPTVSTTGSRGLRHWLTTPIQYTNLVTHWL